jgi:hypothetical protein
MSRLKHIRETVKRVKALGVDDVVVEERQGHLKLTVRKGNVTVVHPIGSSPSDEDKSTLLTVTAVKRRFRAQGIELETQS